MIVESRLAVGYLMPRPTLLQPSEPVYVHTTKTRCCTPAFQWMGDFSWEVNDVIKYADMVRKSPAEEATLDSPELTLELLRTNLVAKKAIPATTHDHIVHSVKRLANASEARRTEQQLRQLLLSAIENPVTHLDHGHDDHDRVTDASSTSIDSATTHGHGKVVYSLKNTGHCE